MTVSPPLLRTASSKMDFSFTVAPDRAKTKRAIYAYCACLLPIAADAALFLTLAALFFILYSMGHDGVWLMLSIVTLAATGINYLQCLMMWRQYLKVCLRTRRFEREQTIHLTDEFFEVAFGETVVHSPWKDFVSAYAERRGFFIFFNGRYFASAIELATPGFPKEELIAVLQKNGAKPYHRNRVRMAILWTLAVVFFLFDVLLLFA